MNNVGEELVDLVDIDHQSRIMENIVGTILEGAEELTLGEVVALTQKSSVSGVVAAKIKFVNLFERYVEKNGYVRVM